MQFRGQEVKLLIKKALYLKGNQKATIATMDPSSHLWNPNTTLRKVRIISQFFSWAPWRPSCGLQTIQSQWPVYGSSPCRLCRPFRNEGSLSFFDALRFRHVCWQLHHTCEHCSFLSLNVFVRPFFSPS